ncbi:MAG: FHA domain-containing protein [Planctomycetes bacterium]|nr:FHA domain-containing protein [Planctomycetota bacterium]
MPYLEIKLGPDTLLLRFVGRIDYVFGRLPRADVQLRDMKVSRLHTQFFIDSRGSAFVRDLGSSGGTWINNQRLRRGVIAPLNEGLKIRVGESRVTFYDGEPPVNAIEPPGASNPRGLIRTNARERFFEAEATVLAMDKVDPETQSGPAEAPPEVNPATFADSPKDLEQKPKPPSSTAQAAPAPRMPTKRNTGIVEAPWEKPKSGPVGPGGEKRVTIPPPTRGGARPSSRTGAVPPPPMQTADIDEEGNFHAPAQQPAAASAPPPAAPKPPLPIPPRTPQPVPLDQLDETGRTSREPVIPDSGAFQPPKPFHGDLPEEEPEESKPRVGMPTVRLERPAILDRQKEIEKEEAEEAALLKIPTAAVKPGAEPPPDEPEPEPQIGVAPRTDTPVAQDDEERDLTDEEIAVYMGGTLSGRYGDVDFGEEGGSSESGAEEDESEEVSFGSAAAKVSLEGDDDIDLEDDDSAADAPAEAEAQEPVDESVEESVEEPAQPEEPEEDHSEYKEPNTSMLGQTTAISEDPVDDEPEPAPEESTGEDSSGPVEDVPTYEDTKTPPPPTREGATEDRTFKPRKTRKLMKRRKDTAKITDKSNPTPLPEGAKTVHVPPPGFDAPIVAGAKTMFIPKPEDAKISRPVPEAEQEDETGSESKSDSEKATGKPKMMAENRERKTLDDMAEGPGGDTVALPPAMMREMQAELRASDPALKSAKDEPPTIGDNPTVKVAGDEEEEEDFILDEDYAFFTPPPATRKAREAAARAAKAEAGDVINANDFHAETDNLPGDKKAASKEDPDTLVD